MIPPWAAKLEVTEQSLKHHRVAAFQPSGSATVRATTLSLQIFLYLRRVSCRFRLAFFSCCECLLKKCQAPTISTGSMQDSGEKSIRLAKSSTSILRHRQALWTRSQQVRNSSP